MIQWHWPVSSLYLIRDHHNEMDAFIKSKNCLIVSKGFLQRDFSSVCHGLRASFAYAKKHQLTIYMRHLEDFHHQCPIHELEQLRRCLVFAKLHELGVIAVLSEKEAIYPFIQDYFNEMYFKKEVTVNSNALSFQHVQDKEDLKSQLGSFLNIHSTCLFYGPPGKGKTFMAKCLAGEWQSHGYGFITIEVHNVLKKHVGEGEEALRRLFQQRPVKCIVFLDELDLLFQKDHHRLISQLCVEMDKCHGSSTLILGATNHIDAIPYPIKRRFETHVAF